MKKELIVRWFVFFIGLMVLGLGIALTVKGQRFGVGSWDVLHIGLFKQIGLSIGLWSIILGIIIITIFSIGLRELPKIGTFANMMFVVLFIYCYCCIISYSNTFFILFIAFVLYVLLIETGCGIYISADLGEGPRDSLMMLAL